ncbi:G2/mitotic-specific cyclin-B [Metarhizium album ARSEF 1941]|uniref:G2/mitotic-specific cyclin-B n=1 Tax=Metarhizium album (strain ARSEF 1941) TaxID=1081103 RepID=A0A0B2WR22_METAS|nr:G2/mitotic-specific cyclin-B [Metarhizium album ARSEF 1941]KHN98511.1 G2/mitotic-specific cyclin-B [Metarhizium album ARSEF 1941]
MPPGELADTKAFVAAQTRTGRQRLVSGENDENSSTRLTRAKAAALNVDELAMPTKSALQPKKSTANLGHAGVQRKRAALGDVSNVNKSEAAEGRKAGGKPGLVSKASHPTGIQKSTTRTATARSTVGVKELGKPEPRRGGSGAIGAGPKRKVASIGNKDQEDSVTGEPQPLRKKAHTHKSADLVRDENHAPAAQIKHQIVDEEDKVAPPAGIRVIEEDDWDDPLMVAEYATEIFEYLRDLECRSIPNPDYMSHQDDLEWKTRGILIDWLIEVHTRFHLLPETLFLAVNIIDRFLSAKVVQLDRLQLVGITAMFIASKYEEVLSPHVENFKRITDNGFSEAEILSAERFLLSTLNYDLSYPNPMNFLRRVSKADNYDIQSRTIGKYLIEISLLDHRFMSFRPSHCAAAAMYLARMMLDRGPWDEILAYYAGYDKHEVQPLVDLMVDYLARPVVHEAFFKKYASKKFLKASILARQWARKNAPLFGITNTELSLDQISSS